MSDINKQTLYRDELGQWFFKGNMIVADEAIFLVLEENASLLTTIESQNSQIESLKAITELAVKGLKNIIAGGSECTTRDFRTLAHRTVSEIEKLSHA